MTASFQDYNEFIQREITPGFVDTVIYDSMSPWLTNFTKGEVKDGDRITSRYRVAHTSNAGFYDKSDVYAAPATQTLVKPYWTKVFSQGTFEVHGIDISNSKMGSTDISLITDAAQKEIEAIADANYSAIFTQAKKDIDSTSVAYSDASLSRSTYPLLASYEEDTNATITLAYVRGMIENVTQNKNVKLSDYLCLMEASVYNTFRPLAAAVNGWNGVNTNTPQTMGNPEVGDFEGLKIAPPEMFPNMTTGDVLMIRRQDLVITEHRPLEIKMVESNRDSSKGVIFYGANAYVDNPYLNGKMTDKD